jgi:pyridoxine 5-phosphate synthase
VWAATLAELAGAHGITAHLREDRRHINDRDIHLLRRTVRTLLNLEMAATEEMIAIALDVRPDVVTLVPEKREERTTEGGLCLASPGLGSAVQRLRDGGIEVSLFVDPDQSLAPRAIELGAQVIELHTGDYCAAKGRQRDAELVRLARAAEAGASSGMRVAGGHGLDYPNVRAVAAIPEIEELNIGHGIIARALFVGMDRAVRDMLAAMNG